MAAKFEFIFLFSLGPLECDGDVLFDNVVTFRRDDAVIGESYESFDHKGAFVKSSPKVK